MLLYSYRSTCDARRGLAETRIKLKSTKCISICGGCGDGDAANKERSDHGGGNDGLITDERLFIVEKRIVRML